ncbi:MAG: ANTAR domain-containing response regulator [Paracoccaceae bacterium]
MTKLRVAVVDADRDRAAMIVEALQEGFPDVEVIVLDEEGALARRLTGAAVDVVLVDLASPSRDAMESIAAASGPLDRPVAMFVDRSDAETTRAAIEAGVSAYVVDGLERRRIRPIVEMAISRFHAHARLRAELAATKAALAERKTIDRAKGLLMKARGLSEEEAYALMRRTAMEKGRRVVDIARALLDAAELLG